MKLGHPVFSAHVWISPCVLGGPGGLCGRVDVPHDDPRGVDGHRELSFVSQAAQGLPREHVVSLARRRDKDERQTKKVEMYKIEKK